LADGWTDSALAEHASIASFSKFSLHLMAVGAPPELLAAAHQAALDEVRHAQQSFEIASIYAGEPLAPGPLDLSGDVLGPLDLPSIVAATVVEGCINETIAALQAQHAAEGAKPEYLRKTLVGIANDEQKHATLAWRFVAWALECGGPPTAESVRLAFAATLDARRRPVPASDPDGAILGEHGRLDDAARHRIRQEAIDQVIRPTVRSLGT
jgi:hypothetical protein